MENHIEQQVASHPILVKGESWSQLPQDLYIPPNALEVFLESFEGPLDLLLYLIKKQNINILDIPIAQITHQYMSYIEMMKQLQLELAGEYLVMAATLAEIKSRLLLPRSPSETKEEEDPRSELIRRLQVYEQYKSAAENLDTLPRQGREIFPITIPVTQPKKNTTLPTLDFNEFVSALNTILQRETLLARYHVRREHLSVRERMSKILEQLQSGEFIPFNDCFDLSEGRPGIIVTFIAILELFRGAIIEVTQTELFSPIYIRVINHE